MRNSHTGMVSLFLGASLASASPVLGPITNPANGHDYYLLEASTWTAAEAEAVGLGGHLVTINDAAEDDWIWTSGLGSAHNWIGFTDAGHEGNWVWISGEEVTYTNWYPGSPSNVGGIEHYGEWDRIAWNDVPNDGWGVPHEGIVEVIPEGCASVSEVGPFGGDFSEGFETLPHREHRQQWGVFNDHAIVRSIGSGAGLYTAELVGAIPGGETWPRTGEVFLFPNGVNAEWVFDTSAAAFGGYFTTLNSTNTIADGVATFFDINDSLICEHTVTAPKDDQWVWNGWTSDIPIKRVEIIGNSTQRTGYVMHDDMEYTPTPDCDGNGIPDQCDLDCGVAGGGCDLPGCGDANDCDTNGIPDECDLFVCDDSNVCTVDTCEPVLGCMSDGTGVSAVCEDGNACTTNDVCQGDEAGTCEGTDTSGVDCDDGNACTDDSCDAATGCANTTSPAGSPCGDPSDTPCDHADTCDGLGACQANFEEDGTPCPDPLFCNGTELCQSGKCTDGSEPCVDAGQAQCDEDNDECTCLLYDMNGDGFASIIGDVPRFVACVYLGICDCPGLGCVCPGDCNCDGFLSIAGDVPCFVDCVYFGNCTDCGP